MAERTSDRDGTRPLVVFPGPLLPNEPLDAFNALGKNGQQINVVPSQGLVVVRMGNSPGTGAAVAIQFADELWAHLNNVFCTTTAVDGASSTSTALPYPVPASDRLVVPGATGEAMVSCLDGRNLNVRIEGGTLDTSAPPMAPTCFNTWTKKVRLCRGASRSFARRTAAC
ncbi:MAG: hypothetical protein IPG92_14320 [Flavobacteriales bacterium]|nr:hypothetical protein [Flavobacteriales bacterium]